MAARHLQKILTTSGLPRCPMNCPRTLALLDSTTCSKEENVVRHELHALSYAVLTDPADI